MDDHEHDALYQLLREVQLERFYKQIRSLDVTKVEHFVNVVLDDLTDPNVGMGAPAARRLLEAAKKRNSKEKWNKNLFNIIIPTKTKKDSRDASLNNRDADDGSDRSSLTCLISSNDLKLMDRIGNGSFGVVMRASWTQSNKQNKYVAVKVLKQDVLLRALEDFAKEVNAMHQLSHPNLIKLYGIVLSSPMMMVTELAEQGSLRLKLMKTVGRISICLLAEFASQIATGMEYLEQKRLIHRDLAARNIFLTDSNVIKIGDFGLMRSVPTGEDYYTMSDNNRVPFPWCAIESLKYRQFSHASDTWMFGVTLWEVFSFGQEPWAGLNGSQIIKKLEQGARLAAPSACPPAVFKVMQTCWKDEPNDRPTFQAMIKFFDEQKPMKLRVLTDFDCNSAKFSAFKHRNATGLKYLNLKTSEEIDVIDGRPDNYWWKGQSQRTWEIGVFPRCVATDLRSLKNADISLPVKNSFIHTGHQDAFGKNSWGNPQFIEKMFIEHPMLAPDIFGIESGEEPPGIEIETRGGKIISNSRRSKGIDKILNIEELALSSPVKEAALIDLGGESLPDEPLKESPAKPPTKPSADLIDIKFESLLDCSIHEETVVNWNLCDSNQNFECDDTTTIATNTTAAHQNNNNNNNNVQNMLQTCNNLNNFFSNGATFDTVFDTTTYGPTSTAEIATTSVPEKSSFIDELKGLTEYKLPEPEAVEEMPRSVRTEERFSSARRPYSDESLQKERYYSSVYNTTAVPPPPSNIHSVSQLNLSGQCDYFNSSHVPTTTSVFDFPSHPTGHATPYDANASCDCCTPYYNNGAPTHSYNGAPASGYGSSAFNSCTAGGCTSAYPPPPPSSSQPPSLPPPLGAPPPLPSQPPVATSNCAQPYPSFNQFEEYRTDECRNFIQSLEQDFSRFGSLKNSKHAPLPPPPSNTNSVFPSINPPPKSVKIRRPAPQPPGNRKIA